MIKTLSVVIALMYSSGACIAADAVVGECGLEAGVVCKGNFYCRFEKINSCGVNGEMGSCTPRPESCTAEFEQVCGCDGITYANRCLAARDGVTDVLHDGPC
jgi:hypothetical protein